MIPTPVNITEDVINTVIQVFLNNFLSSNSLQKFQSDKEPISFVINISFEHNEPEEFGLDLGRFPLKLQNDITSEELNMAMIQDEEMLTIRRVPNDFDWPWLSKYINSLWNVPSISIGKWVWFQF